MCDSMHSKKKGEIKEKVFLSFSLGTFQRNAKKKKKLFISNPFVAIH